MPRIQPIDPETAPDATRDVLEDARAQLGSLPKLMTFIANSPAALRGWLAFRAELDKGALPRRLRQQLAVLIAEENGSRYCVAANTARGVNAGIGECELAANQRAQSENPATEAALTFAAAVLASRGRVTDAELARVRKAGFSDGEITEMVAHVALNTFTNFFCQVARPDLDVPAVPMTTDEEF